MASNTAEYQKKYRAKNARKRKIVSVSFATDDYRLLSDYADEQDMNFSTLIREASLHQVRGSNLRSKGVEEQLKRANYLLANFANNLNQIAHYENEVKHAIDNDALSILVELRKSLQEFVDISLKENI
ncbi:MAG: hypothetical protein JKY08_06015 [Flavobacteriaceae bacterium]|nr:hypothetical protein [Flavobacteriaceae bacterium]